MNDNQKIENELVEAEFLLIRDGAHRIWEKNGVRVGVTRGSKAVPHGFRGVRAAIRRADRNAARNSKNG